MNCLSLIPKTYDKDTIRGSVKIFRDRELIVESEGTGDNTVLRFKIGDGVKPYSALPYVSSMYSGISFKSFITEPHLIFFLRSPLE